MKNTRWMMGSVRSSQGLDDWTWSGPEARKTPHTEMWVVDVVTGDPAGAEEPSPGELDWADDAHDRPGPHAPGSRHPVVGLVLGIGFLVASAGVVATMLAASDLLAG